MLKSIFLISLLALLACGGPNKKTISAGDAGLIPGTENPIIKDCAKGKAYLYNNYEIHVEPSPEHWGMNIFLYSPDVSQGNPCTLDRKTASHIISARETGENNFFAGLYKNYLFLDQGTEPEQRILSVYDLATKRLILLTEYSDPALKDGVLTFYKTLVPEPGVIENIPCPKSQSWKDKGLNVLYEQKENYTLETETRLPIREYRCRAGQ
ncbi:MAG: hypothetical protein AAF462_08770 [Thermodesulfobacteriota bacterium]